MKEAMKEAMRTIKFRGKSKQTGEWLVGYYLKNRGADFACPDEFANGKGWVDYEVDLATVGQFTGLIDKNGTEIYEGDILASESQRNRCIVEWNRLLAQFQGTWSDMPITAADIHTLVLLDYKVIGNIHDNPDLLNTGA